MGAILEKLPRGNSLLFALVKPMSLIRVPSNRTHYPHAALISSQGTISVSSLPSLSPLIVPN